MSAVRPLLEFACPVWHTSLTKEQSGQIKSIQKQAFKIIFNNNCIDCDNFCRIHQLQTLTDRYSESCRFFNKHVVDEKSCLYYLLPPPYIDEHRFYGIKISPSHQELEPHAIISFILYALNNYQSNSR